MNKHQGRSKIVHFKDASPGIIGMHLRRPNAIQTRISTAVTVGKWTLSDCMRLQTTATQSLWFPGIVNNSIYVGYLVGPLWRRIGPSQGLKPHLTFLTSQTKQKQSACDAKCIVLWAWNGKGVPALQHQYSYLTGMSLYVVWYDLLFFSCLFSILCFLCCFVYCVSFCV